MQDSHDSWDDLMKLKNTIASQKEMIARYFSLSLSLTSFQSLSTLFLNITFSACSSLAHAPLRLHVSLKTLRTSSRTSKARVLLSRSNSMTLVRQLLRFNKSGRTQMRLRRTASSKQRTCARPTVQLLLSSSSSWRLRDSLHSRICGE